MTTTTSFQRIIILAITGLLLSSSCKKSNLNNEEVMQMNISLPLQHSRMAASNMNLVYEETMEASTPFSKARAKEVGSWKYALQIVSNPVFQGKKSARFEIRKDQPLIENGKRSEIVVVKGSKGDITKNTWYSFAAYFPSLGYEYDKEREIINQWYQDGSPSTSLRTQKDRFLLEAGNKTSNRVQYDLGPITKDTWHQFVLHFIHSYSSDGLIEIWHNGTKVLTRRGGNMYNDVLPKWKIGLYKASFKSEKSLVDKRIIYFDNIRVGNKNASYENMIGAQNP